jgi:anti-anti-sigma factor
MNTEMTKMNVTMVMAPSGLTELVRGSDRDLVDRMAPIVRQKSVALDLKRIDRIDAAGVAALISLYGHARDAGHGFAVANPNAHVREILEIVGLDRILLPEDRAAQLETEACLAQSAA